MEINGGPGRTRTFDLPINEVTFSTFSVSGVAGKLGWTFENSGHILLYAVARLY